MKLLPFELKNVEVGKPVYGVGYIGMGLLTSICVMFANLFGVKSKQYEDKMIKAKERAEEMMISQTSGYDGVMCVSYNIIGHEVMVNGVCFKYVNQNEPNKASNKKENSKPIVKEVSKPSKAVDEEVKYPSDYPKDMLLAEIKGNKIVTLKEMLVSPDSDVVLPEASVGDISKDLGSFISVNFNTEDGPVFIVFAETQIRR